MIMVITIEVFFCFYMLTNMQTVSSSFGMQGERMDVKLYQKFSAF